jgi:hypothetical protein
MKAIVIVPFLLPQRLQNKDFQISHTLKLVWVLEFFVCNQEINVAILVK